MKKFLTLFFAIFAIVAAANAQDISSSIAPLYDGPVWGTISDTGITCSGGPNTSIIRDDGSYENGYRTVATGDSTTFVQKMVMPSIPFTLSQMCVTWTSLSPGGNITYDLIIYDTTGAGGKPGNVVYRVNNVVANATGIYPAHTRYSYPINFVTTQRAYYVGVRWNNNPIIPQFISSDENGPVSTMGPGYQRKTTTYPPAFDDVSIDFPTFKSFGIRLEGTSVVPPVACNYTWSTQVSGTTALLYSVKAVSNLVGWAAGAGAVVRRTTDGGTTWGNGNPNPGVITGDIYNIEAIDANTAWVTTSPGATFIYKTTNGGTTWVQVYTVAAGFLNTIKMVTPLNGYAFGDVLAGTWLVLTTIDGGSTWTTLPTAPAGSGDGRNNCLQVSLPNIWFGTGQSTVVRSTNAGLTWAAVPSTGITGQVTGLQFNSSTVGLIGGATMSKSTDGGSTYALLTAPGTGVISGIKGSGNDFWYTRGLEIYRTTNAGTSWTLAHTQTAAQNDISLVSDLNGCMTGWSAGTTGTISKMTGVPVGISDPTNQIPSTFKLEQNYPNPFNPTTNITYSLPVSGNVELKIYDLVGREVTTLVNTFVNAGTHMIPFDASALASGIYIYKINSGSFTDSKKMVLIK